MRAFTLLLLFGVSVLSPRPALAQRSVNPSVYEVKPLVDGAIIGVGVLAAAVAYFAADRWIRQTGAGDKNSLNFIDRNSVGNSNPTLDVISDITVGAAMLAPPILDAFDLGFSPAFKEDLWVYAETLSVNNFMTTVAKYSVQRPLPRTYADDPNLVHQPGGYRSFYSGHTSTAFSSLSTAAMTLNLRYHSGIWPWLVVAGVGTSVAIERVAAGRHFPTDVMVGAVAGTLVGAFVPYWHAKGTPDRLFITAAPIDTGGMLYARIRF